MNARRCKNLQLQLEFSLTCRTTGWKKNWMEEELEHLLVNPHQEKENVEITNKTWINVHLIQLASWAEPDMKSGEWIIEREEPPHKFVFDGHPKYFKGERSGQKEKKKGNL